MATCDFCGDHIGILTPYVSYIPRNGGYDVFRGKRACVDCARNEMTKLYASFIRDVYEGAIRKYPDLKGLVAKMFDVDSEIEEGAKNRAYDYVVWYLSPDRGNTKPNHPLDPRSPEGVVRVFRGLVKARDLERSGRFEDAAEVIDGLEDMDRGGELKDEAGRLRRQSRTTTIKQVTVDLNALLDKLSHEGVTIPYKCRSCGATITIDSRSTAEGLRFCSYCGGAMDTDSLTEILRSALK